MMIKMSLYRQSALPVLEKGLNTYAQRDKAISNNLANVTTPDYQRIKVDFEEELKKALDLTQLQGWRTDNDHLSLGRKETFEVNPSTYRAEDDTNPGEINNVDIDMEASGMAENQIAFNFAVSMFKDQTTAMRSAIKGSSQG